MKHFDASNVDTSFTLFFFSSTVVLSWFLSDLFPETRYASLAVIGAFAVLLYFVWDIIRQLFEPMQALFLYVVTFLILPFAMNLVLDFPYGRLGIAVLLGAYAVSFVLELIYEGFIKGLAPRVLMRRLLAVDGKIDDTMTQLSWKHIYPSDYKGVSLALVLITFYFAISYLLFHR